MVCFNSPHEPDMGRFAAPCRIAPGEGETRHTAAYGPINRCIKKALARSRQGKKPAHVGPALLYPIFNIPGVGDRAAAARDNPHTRQGPQSTQRRGVSGPICKRVTMVFHPSHLFFLQLYIFSSIHSQRATAAQNRINGTRKYFI